MPGARTYVTLAPFAGVPVHPDRPVNWLPPLVPVYLQAPPMPATVNAPGVGKFAVAATLSVPPARFWLAPLTVVEVVEVTTAPFATVPVQPLRPVNLFPPLMPV